MASMPEGDPRSAPVDDAVVRRSLRISVIEGALWALMVGASESYLGALAVELGHKDLSLALLVTLPLLFGALGQVASSWLVKALGSRKRVVVFGASIQASAHIGFFLIASLHETSFWALMVVQIVYWTSGMAVAPAWNAWMGALTRTVHRGRYFSSRSAVVQIALFGAFAGAGVLLEQGRKASELLPMFAALNAIALLARMASVAALAKQADPYGHEENNEAPMRERMLLALRSSKWRIAVFVVVFYFGANIGIPFFTPYMLKVLHFDFVTFMLVSAVSVLFKAVTFPLWSRLADRVGLRPVLFLSTLGVAVIAILWASATSVPQIMVIQAISGVSWAGFEFASFQLLLKSARDEHRVAFFALSTSATGIAQVTGSLVGAALLVVFPYGYEVSFVATGFGRALPCLLLLSPIVAGLSRGPLPRVFFRVISVRADGGGVRTPIVSRERSIGNVRSPRPLL